MSSTFTLHADNSPFMAVMDELNSLLPLPREILDRFLSLKQKQSNLFTIDRCPASGAGDVRYVFNPALPLLELLAAARASKVE